MAKLTKKARNELLNRLGGSACLDLQIPIMELSTIQKAGERALDEGFDEDATLKHMRAVAERVAIGVSPAHLVPGAPEAA